MHKQTSLKLLSLAVLVSAASFFLFSGTSHAATLTVAAGNDETTTNSSCSFSEAITNINDQAATYPDCAAGDGTNDTITLPTGTITLTADLPGIFTPVIIEGAGMNATTIDGAGSWKAFDMSGAVTNQFRMSDLRIVGFTEGAINLSGVSASIDRVEIDGSNTPDSIFKAGIITGNNTSETTSISITDVYVHGFTNTTPDSSIGGIIISADTGSTLNASLKRITVSNMTNTSSGTQIYGIIFASGAFKDFSPSTMSLDAENVTISNVSSTAGNTAGLMIVNGVTGGASNVAVNIRNATITNITGAESPLKAGQYGASIGLMGAAFQGGDVANTTVSATNLLLVNAAQTPSTNCAAGDFNSMMNGLGTVTNTITSQGGNLSDDNSCSTYFTQSTDQNNVAALAASLLPLADNGGYVPTMALKEGSPAIDSGITIAGLTTDARGITRPQGTAYDSGAYESPYSKPATPTLAKSGESIIFIGLGAVVGLLSLGLVVRRKHVYSAR